MGFSGKQLWLLLLGATVSGLLAAWLVRRWQGNRLIGSDGAMAATLGGGFALGTLLLSVAQRVPGGNSTGLSHFVFGRAASMTSDDVQLLIWLAVIIIVCTVVLRRSLAMLCFDESFTQAQGMKVALLDGVLSCLLVAVVTRRDGSGRHVIGVSHVGPALRCGSLLESPHGHGTHHSWCLGAVSGAVGTLLWLSSALSNWPYHRVVHGCGDHL